MRLLSESAAKSTPLGDSAREAGPLNAALAPKASANPAPVPPAMVVTPAVGVTRRRAFPPSSATYKLPSGSTVMP